MVVSSATRCTVEGWDKDSQATQHTHKGRPTHFQPDLDGDDEAPGRSHCAGRTHLHSAQLGQDDA